MLALLLHVEVHQLSIFADLFKIPVTGSPSAWHDRAGDTWSDGPHMLAATGLSGDTHHSTMRPLLAGYV